MISSEHTPAEQILKELPPAPEDVRQFILSNCPAYMIINRNGNAAICTGCENEFDMYSTPQYNEPVCELYSDYFEYKHNGIGKCPYCGRDVTVKSVGRGRKKLTQKHRVLIPVVKDNTLYMTLTEVIVDYRGWGAQLKRWISAIYKVNDNELTYYKHHPRCYYEEYWELRREFKLPPKPLGIYKRESDWNDYIYPVYVGKFCDRIKYIDIDTITDERGWEAHYYVGMIREAHKYPVAIEMLYKSGFKNIVYGRIAGRKSRSLNMRAKTLPKIFRSNMETVRDLRECNANIYEVEEYTNALRKYAYRMHDQKEYRKVREIENAMRHYNGKVDMQRAVKYTLNHNIWGNEWIDYMIQLRELGMKLNSKNMYPKNFQRQHRMLSERVRVKKDEIIREKMKRMVIEKTGETIKINELIFIPATTPEELEKEGEQQHHCVAMYAERVARGQCLIYMIRKISEPEKSYVTMELAPEGVIRQLRGFANSNPDEDVRAAAEKFAEEFKKNINKKERETA